MSEGYAAYLGQTGMEQANKPTNLALDNFKDFGKLLSAQAADKSNLLDQLDQKESQFQRAQQLEKAKFGEEQYQFDQKTALEQEKMAREERRNQLQDSNLNLQMEMNRMKMERDKIDFSREDEINRFLSDPEQNKKFMDAVAKGDLKGLMSDPKTGAMITSMYVSKSENLNKLANQIIAKNQDQNIRLPIQLMTPKMKDILGNVDGENINKNLVSFSQEVANELTSGRITKAEAQELLKSFTPISTNVKTQLNAEKVNIAQQNADSSRMNSQANIERAKNTGSTGGFITPDGSFVAQDKVADYIAKNPGVDYSQLRNAKTLKSVDKKQKESAFDKMIREREERKTKSIGGK